VRVVDRGCIGRKHERGRSTHSGKQRTLEGAWIDERGKAQRKVRRRNDLDHRRDRRAPPAARECMRMRERTAK
jgi:hypothetical protein